MGEPYLFMNGEDINVHDKLANKTVENYNQLLGSYRLLYVDKAQKITEIGQKLKLMVDEIQGLKIIVSNSSSFDIHKDTGEPLTGRKYSFNLLRLIAFQIGSEVSLQELGGQLSISKNTVEKYLDLLSKVYILWKVLAVTSVKKLQKAQNGTFWIMELEML